MESGMITRILQRVNEGESAAVDELLPHVYDQVRSLASAYMRAERPGHTLQPTLLAHEAFLRLVGNENVVWQSRAHFLSLIARAMRRILVDHARDRARAKRGGGAQMVSLQNVGAAPDDGLSADELLALDSALRALASTDERKAKIVELLYFGGLTSEEVAEVVGVSSRTVKRDWQYARAWLVRNMTCPTNLGGMS